MNSKRKGNDGERELAKLLLDHGIDSHRNDQMYIGGKNNPDISAEFQGIPLHLEVKRVEHLNLGAAISQAVKDADGNAFPVVIHRANRKPWIVSFRLDDLWPFLRR